jgi:hypothetical protein
MLVGSVVLTGCFSNSEFHGTWEIASYTHHADPLPNLVFPKTFEEAEAIRKEQGHAPFGFVIESGRVSGIVIWTNGLEVNTGSVVQHGFNTFGNRILQDINGLSGMRLRIQDGELILNYSYLGTHVYTMVFTKVQVDTTAE